MTHLSIKTDRQALAWDAAVALGRFNRAEIAAKTGMAETEIVNECNRWLRCSAVRRVTAPGRVPVYYDVVHHRPQEGTPDRSPEQSMWRTLRMLKVCSARDIAAHATLPDAPVSEAAAERFAAMLVRGGYARIAQKRNPRTGRLTVFRLIRDTGPQPPAQRRLSCIYDPNLEAVTHVPAPVEIQS